MDPTAVDQPEHISGRHRQVERIIDARALTFDLDPLSGLRLTVFELSVQRTGRWKNVWVDRLKTRLDDEPAELRSCVSARMRMRSLADVDSALP